MARRAVRYHRVWLPRGGEALDVGCGEGQDLLFLAEQGYAVTGIELTRAGAEKARRLLADAGQSGEIIQGDAADIDIPGRYDLVLAVNALQFMGAHGGSCLDQVLRAVRPGGVVGLSLFARRPADAPVSGTLWFTSLEEVLERLSGWQMLEAARLWQWNTATNEPQAFVTAIARNRPPSRSGLLRLD